MAAPDVDADVVTAVCGYARRLHATIGATHHVASPLGAWLLLALAARTGTGPARAVLDAVLGMDAGAAAEVAGHLLADRHPLVHAAAAAWRGPAGRTPAVADWLGTLPPPVATGDVDTQETLDRWADENTAGMIDRFPLPLSADTLLVLATALATKVTWRREFDIAPVERLGPAAAWPVREVLSAEAGDGHEVAILTTDTVGDVIVHVADASTDASADGAGLRVVSVAAARDVPAGAVLDAAHRIAVAAGAGGSLPGRRPSLFDLPLGDAPLWRITERPVRIGRSERFVAHLPAWTARSDHDLTPPELGLLQAGTELGVRFGEPRAVVRAKQVALARYGRRGFEAAAVSAMMVARSAAVSVNTGRRRTAEVRFAHPYAAVAVATGAGPWTGLPVFSAWVAEAADDPDAGMA